MRHNQKRLNHTGEMTTSNLEEWNYVYQERMGMHECDRDDETPWMRQIAADEADKAVERMKTYDSAMEH